MTQLIMRCWEILKDTIYDEVYLEKIYYLINYIFLWHFDYDWKWRENDALTVTREVQAIGFPLSTVNDFAVK